MSEEKRMIESYEIRESFCFGGIEYVVAVDEKAPNGMFYLCCEVEYDELFERYNNAVVGDNYSEIVADFSERIKTAAETLIQKQQEIPEPTKLIPNVHCIADNYTKSIVNKIVAVDPSTLAPEYRIVQKQLYYVTGGFGANPNSRGTKVYCKNIYDGTENYFRRSDILGEVKPEHIPKWAESKIKEITHKEQMTKKKGLDR